MGSRSPVFFFLCGGGPTLVICTASVMVVVGIIVMMIVVLKVIMRRNACYGTAWNSTVRLARQVERKPQSVRPDEDQGDACRNQAVRQS